MKVLIVVGSYLPMKCGVGDYTRSLAHALSEQPDTDIGVLTDIAAAPGAEMRAARLTVFPVVDGRSQKRLETIASVCDAFKPDLIHFQWPSMGYATWGKLTGFGGNLIAFIYFLALKKRIPVVTTWHEPYPLTLPRFWYFIATRGLIFVRENYFDLMPGWFRSLMRFKPYRIIKNASTIPVMAPDEPQRQVLRDKLKITGRNIVVFFGFIYPNKRVEDVFETADPACDHIVLVGELGTELAYHRDIRALAESEKWRGNVTITGFASTDGVSEILAAADAVVLPFEKGGGSWNTSIHAAQAQGPFLLTTSMTRQGYSPEENTYYVKPGDVPEMKTALRTYIGKRVAPNLRNADRWRDIARAHIEFYKHCLGRNR